MNWLVKFSFHCELGPCARQDLVSDNHFLGTSPEVFMAPSVTPFHEVNHWEHREAESPDEALPSNDRKEQISGRWCQETILEPSVLIVRNEVFAFSQVVFGNRRDVWVSDQECDQLSLVSPSWVDFAHGFSVESSVWFHGALLSSVHVVDFVHIFEGVVTSEQIALDRHFCEIDFCKKYL